MDDVPGGACAVMYAKPSPAALTSDAPMMAAKTTTEEKDGATVGGGGGFGGGGGGGFGCGGKCTTWISERRASRPPSAPLGS